MTFPGWRVSQVAVLCAAFVLSACATIPIDRTAQPAPAPAVQADDDDFTELSTQLKVDLNRYNSREIARRPTVAPTATTAKVRDKEFADRAKALFAPIGSLSLRMPVVGVRTHDLTDSWHDPRDGGSRLHKGIDIFAPRGTEIVAVADGIISYIGDQPKGGHCLWLTTESGTAFYYAHLDRWAPGLYEGMEVQSGDLLGFVGNTGNAIHTPSHLHFGINQNDEMVDPYPLLTRATPTQYARRHVDLGGGVGTR